MIDFWKSNRFALLALVILLGASALRLVGFQTVPPGLMRDEVLNADIVELIRNGQHSLFFREGYGHEPLYHYFGVPFQRLLGDNALAIRLPSFFLGMLLIALSVPWAKRLTGSRTVALLCALGLALGWWPIIFSRLGLRAISLPVLLVLGHYYWLNKKPVLAAVCIGLSFYTYTAARVMLGLPILMLLDAYLFQKDKQNHSATWSFAAVTYAIYLPLQMMLWRDPTLQSRVGQLSAVTDAASQGDFAPLWQNILATLGVFTISGDPLWSYANSGQPLFDWLSGLLLLGGLGLIVWQIQTPKFRLVLYWFSLALLPTILAPEAPSLIRLIGILPLVYLMIAVGSDQLIALGKKHGRLLVLLIPIAFGWQFYSTVADGFIAWSQATPTIEKYGPIWRDMAADIKAHPDAHIVIADSWVDPIDHDRVVRSIGENRPLRWVAVDQNVTSGAIAFPAESQSGSTPIRFYLPEFANLNATLADRVRLADPIYRSETWPTFAVYELANLENMSTVDNDQTFQSALTLLNSETVPFINEGRLEVYTLWRVEDHLPDDLAMFVHLTESDSRAIAAQHDGFDAFIPQLQIGDLILQRHLIWLPEGFSQQQYELSLGIYQRQNNGRWQTDSGADVLFLEEVGADQ